MKSILSLSLLCASLFALSGCKTVLSSPGLIPTGYTYHDTTPNSVPGNSANDIGYDYSDAENNRNVLVWTSITKRMIDHVQSDMGAGMPHIYALRGPSYSGAHNRIFEYGLYKALDNAGYTIAPKDPKAFILQYAAHETASNHSLHKTSRDVTRMIPAQLILQLHKFDGTHVRSWNFEEMVPPHGFYPEKTSDANKEIIHLDVFQPPITTNN